MNTTTARKQTAAQAYAARSAKIDTLLVRLASAADAHKARAKSQPENWGFAGDLHGVESQLVEALRMLGVDAEGGAL